MPAPAKTAAPAGASAAANDTSNIPVNNSNTVREKLTVLETFGPVLTKTYKSDDTTEPYGDAHSFKVKQVEVNGLRQVANILSKLHPNPTRCLIRGKFIGHEKAAKGNVEGSIVRTNANFDDQPLHWFMVDIDGFEPGFADPVLNPDLAVLEFIEAALPEEFKGASFYWHLSSSAGMPGKEGILKCHVHFWSKTAYTTAQMYEWAKVVGTAVDKAVYRRVQVHYTADPIFEEGRVDPVPVRAGWYQGEHDEVDLQISEELLAQARDQGAGAGGQDMKLVDPSEKDGLIGAFHRAFTPEQVLLEILEGEFEQVTERRYTWLNGGGTPEGVWLHTDGMHVGSSHNTWPIDGIANLWDLVRVFKFGDLDIGKDDFERMDLDHTPVGARPSDLAMKDWASQLPEIKALIAEEGEQTARARFDAMADWRTKIRATTDEFELRETICQGIGEDEQLTADHRATLAGEINTRFGVLGLAKPGLPAVKKMLQPKQHSSNREQPEWLKGWCYVTDWDKFYRSATGEKLTHQGFRAKYNRKCSVFTAPNGHQIQADTVALEIYPVPVVVRDIYFPGKDAFLTINGVRHVNSYRPNLVPLADDRLNAEGRRAVELVRKHILAICNGREEVANHLLDWVAHNVQYPGKKIRHSPIIQGVEGDGKTMLGTLLAATMGGANVKDVSPTVIVGSNFTAWAEGACVRVLEELRLQGHSRFDILNSVKPYITNDAISVHPKGVDPYDIPNVTNYLALTNFKDALPLNDTDRRWMVIFTPWHSIAEFEKVVGCNNDAYFARLHQALFEHTGALRRWLLDRDLSAFNCNGRAPETEEKRIMVSFGVSDEVSIAKELIEKGGYGFSEKVVSTSLLSAAIGREGIEPPKTTSMRHLMIRLGYRPFAGTVKWDQRAHRVWVKAVVTLPEEVRRLLDATAEKVVEGDFSD